MSWAWFWARSWACVRRMMRFHRLLGVVFSNCFSLHFVFLGTSFTNCSFFQNLLKLASFFGIWQSLAMCPEVQHLKHLSVGIFRWPSLHPTSILISSLALASSSPLISISMKTKNNRTQTWELIVLIKLFFEQIKIPPVIFLINELNLSIIKRSFYFFKCF